MAGILQKLFGGDNEKALTRLGNLVAQIGEFEPALSSLNAEQFAGRTAELREQLSNGAPLDGLLPEAFALVREAARRTVGMRPFDAQLLGGIVLHQGRIAEMKTGEGKTLAATMPAYLNALTGKGVHIVTVNDYLARRDSEWMGPVYRLLGLKVGLIVHGLDQQQRQQAYAADLVYGTNNEFGFDYLRDNMVLRKEQLVQRELNFAIVDEVDSILIDEARTPLIISSQAATKHEYGRWRDDVERLIRKQGQLVNELLKRAERSLEAGDRDEAGEQLLMVRRGAPKYKKLLKLFREQGIERLVERTRHRLMAEKLLAPLEEAELYFSIDEATRMIDIKEKGTRELERINPELARLLRYEKEASGEDASPETESESSEHRHYVEQLIKAYMLYEKDVDYVLQDNKVVIVDEFTGRLMPGRRYSEGIHQAIEAKENVQIQADTRTVASITFQNFFRMYGKLAGMTGTAATEEEEFRKIYGMDVVRIPTHEKMIRHDLSDLIYRTERGKFKAVIEEVERRHEIGQPVLVGTISVEKSELLSRILKTRKIPHQVLNAVHHEAEARVIAQAGRRGAVTISTNMAGRGTDIILGGNPDFLAREQFNKELAANDEKQSPEALEEQSRRYDELLSKFKRASAQERAEVLSAGGLHVLGTERHESRRIDNQLRGRSGRQGDPGSAQFFISLEDDLMRLFGAGNIASIMDRLGMEEDLPIEHPLIGGAIERAQKKVESRNFEIRRHLLDYDDVLNEQRKVIYGQRRRVLDGENMRQPVLEMIEENVDRLLQRHFADRGYLEEGETAAMIRAGEGSFLRRGKFEASRLEDLERSETRELLLEEARAFYASREAELGEEIIRELERVVLLRTVDSHWMDFIDAMHELRREIGLQAYGQRDPLVAYRRESYNMFEDMRSQIQEDVVRLIYQLRVAEAPQRRAVTGPTAASHRSATPVGGGSPPRGEAPRQQQQPATSAKVGRNQPCPCGSGKKYKKCCGT